MKILAVIPSYKPAYHYGGPVRSVASLFEAMVREGHSVTVFTSNANGKEKLKKKTNTPHWIDGVEVYYFNRWTGDHSNFTPKLLLEIWKRIKTYDVVHIHAWWNLISIPAVVLCLWRGKKPFLSPRGSITNYTFSHQKAFVKRWFHAIVGKGLLQKCIIHVTSRKEEEDVLLYTSGATICTVPNLLALKDQIITVHNETHALRLIYLGRIDPKKNIEFLLDVVLGDFEIPFSLEFIGDGSSEYISNLKRKTLAHPSIKWLGPIYDDSKWPHLASSDVLLLPSINENYGNVILEALSQGTAVLVSDQVGLKDYITTNQLGWVAKTDIHTWRNILRGALEDRSVLHQIRTKAPSCIQHDFNQPALVFQYEAMYRAAMNPITSNLV